MVTETKFSNPINFFTTNTDAAEEAAAYYVAKYNIYQKDGISRVYGDDEKDDLTPSKPGESESESDKPSSETDSENAGGSSEKDQITIVEAVGMDSGLQITYKGSEVVAYNSHLGQKLNASLNIGNNVRATSRCRITCAREIVIEDDVLLAPEVFIMKLLTITGLALLMPAIVV